MRFLRSSSALLNGYTALSFTPKEKIFPDGATAAGASWGVET
ncbi:MAG: hypothetical protein M0013_01610 [Actinomycetota bacterium]|nr:hypothetical protein [Actinomycetota bacterium]